jgi:hypothetical protein
MGLTSVILLWFVVGPFPQPSPAATGSLPDSAELSRLESVWNDAHLRGEADALDRLCADDLLVTVPGMRMMTKAESIGVLRAGRMRFVRYETSDVRIRLYDAAAVVTGRLQRTRIVDGQSRDDDWRFTKTYVKRAGQWRVVAFHASITAQ